MTLLEEVAEMEQQKFTKKKNAEHESSQIKNAEIVTSEMENAQKETLEVNTEKVLSETSDKSMNSPSSIVKDRGKSEYDEKCEASGDSSLAQNNQDFRVTAKYRDVESYVQQHHHSIGEGLYMTDEIRDLPPRFRTKVMQALENALAIHNIKLDRNPLEYFTSFNDDSSELGKNQDKLVYIPPNILEDKKKSIESTSDSASLLKTNFIEKKSFDSHHHSNFGPPLRSLEREKPSFSGANLGPQVPSQNFKNKASVKSEPHLSRTYSDNPPKNRDFSNIKKSSSNTNSGDLKNYTRISIDEIFPNYEPDSNSTPVLSDTSSVSSVYGGVALNTELNKRYNGNIKVPCNDSTINVNTKTHNKKRTLTDSKTLYESADRKSTSFNENKKPFKSHGKFPNINSSPPYENYVDSSKYSACHIDTRNNTHSLKSTKGVKSESQEFQSDKFFDKNKTLKYNKTKSDVLNRCQNASKSPTNSGKDNFSNSNDIPSKNFTSDKGKKYDNSRHLRNENAQKYPNKKELSCNSGKVLDIPLKSEESNVVKDLFSKNTSVQNKHRRSSDSHSSISSSYSSKSYNNVPSHNDYLSINSQDSCKRSVNNVNSSHNSFESFSHKKPMYRQFDGGRDYNKKSNNYRHYKDKYSDSSSVLSDKSGKTCNSSDNISSVRDNFNQNEKSFSDRICNQTNSKCSAKPSGKYFAEEGRQKFFQNSKLSLKDQEISVKKHNLSYPAENRHYSNKTNYSLSKSSYNEKYHELRSKEYEKEQSFRVCTENGFFVKVEVSEKVTDLECWMKYFQSKFLFPFELERCCHFSDIFILEFEKKEHAYTGLNILHKEKKILQNLKKPHFLLISKLLYHLTKPCNCREKILSDCVDCIKKYFESSLCVVKSKIEEIAISKTTFKKHNTRNKDIGTENKILESFQRSKSSFTDFKEKTVCDVQRAENLRTIQQLKHLFIRECNIFKRCLPIYAKKFEILDLARYHPVSVIVAETGSGKSTQLVEYLLHSSISENGLIICTQPRKLAAVTIAQFVSGQMGSAIGKIVGYDVGIEKKCSDLTKIIYMTDYCLLKYFLKNRNLKGVSCVVIDEAHERSLYTDLILGLLKKCLEFRRDLSVLITSATINPTIFVNYFKMPENCVIEVSGRTYPVDVVWYPNHVEIGWDYLDACVRKAYEIHVSKKGGDILVFLTSPSESEEAICLFKRLSNNDKNVQLLSLHGKSDIQEQMLIFQNTSVYSRKIIFATNVAETAVTIPGIKYVVDSGMSKELMFDPQKNKSYLAVTFTTKSAAEQRKGRAGRTQSGICYRMYSKRNYAENMTDNAVPEILKSNLQKALLKIFEFGIDPEKFDFIEAPSAKTICNSVESLEHLGAIKDKKLTDFGKKLVKLPLEPQLSKLVLQGIDAKIGIEAIIIAVLVSESGKLFIRYEDNRAVADEKKRKFCHEGGDLCTYLEIYKRWKEINCNERYTWCVDNFINFKALSAAAKNVKEILITLKTELGLSVSSRYNNNDYKKQFEKIIFDSFSENLCVLSGHPKLGYLSPYLSESFFIHPSSTLSFLGKDLPEFLVYSTLMETSRNFLFDITPISEATLKLAYQTGKFRLPLHTLRCLQVPPKIMGPYGESVLIRHILGKGGAKIKDLEKTLMHITSVKNLYIDVDVTKGLITLYISRKLCEKASSHVQQIISEALTEILKEEDVVKLTGTSLYFALSAGGIINDVVMPGEFRELVFNHVKPKDTNEFENTLQIYGPLQSLSHITTKQEMQICATFKKVSDAKKAFLDLKEKKKYYVSPKPYLPDASDKTVPLHVLLISWCCSPSTGFGKVELYSEEDIIVAAGTLTANSFFVGNNLILFEVAPDGFKLTMKNLPEFVEECTIREKLKESLPHIQVKSIQIFRKPVKITEAAVEEAKKKLTKLLSLYVSSLKFIIDLKYPQKEASWNATVYFDSAADIENTFVKLKDNTCIDSYPLSVRQIFKSKLYCIRDVFERFSVQVNTILKREKAKGFCDDFCITKLKENNVTIEFSCVNLEKLYKTRQSLLQFLEGEYLEFIGNSKYHFLFTACLEEQIRKIQKSTNTLINLDKIKKVISIYGCRKDCQKAKEEIYLLAHNPDYSFTRTFNLKDSCIPNGFLKHLYSKYGYDLHRLVADFKLIVASIDNHGSTLTLKGLKGQIRKAEQALEKMCEELFESRGKHRKTSQGEEACSICFDPVSYDFQRLEHCGHAFCRQCLLLQLESKAMPLVCVKQDCGKLIFLEDIKRIISLGGGDHLKKTFCAVALQYHVSCNIGKLSYCRTPDCQMIYRVTKEGSEYNCPSCKNSTCTRCQSPYHFGMSCEMFQECQKDVDHSLKTWVKEKESSRKYCPSCETVIEKDGGCNHMQCLNCKVHLCWLCLKIFKTDDEVYNHIPYCPKNQ